MKKPPIQPSDFDADARTEALIREYLKHTGKRIPETKEEVAAMLDLMKARNVEAPERLRARDIFACNAPAKVYKLPNMPVTTEATQQLRRAAREGKEISPQVEAQMRADRAKAKGGNSSAT